MNKNDIEQVQNFLNLVRRNIPSATGELQKKNISQYIDEAMLERNESYENSSDESESAISNNLNYSNNSV